MDKPYPNKPDTMSHKDYFILKVSQEWQMPVPTVRIIIENQFRTAKAALANDDINSIELAGFGRFYFNLPAAKRYIKKYIDLRKKYNKELKNQELSPTKVRNFTTRLETLDRLEKNLKQKLGL